MKFLRNKNLISFSFLNQTSHQTELQDKVLCQIDQSFTTSPKSYSTS
jgi:hypothetical protein